ncbi:putative histidine kinase M3YPp [Sclerotinia borealis F-4128]|uniref:Putative histidine kinase M3YPp n=1 Tax=Sclerotinia borealis (strain F-4128) TaxID=1432307 RepID=W9CMI5_SCLBF|nr:putative histidine kinase M3YPp [Sclerotinia borealis F-4128]
MENLPSVSNRLAITSSTDEEVKYPMQITSVAVDPTSTHLASQEDLRSIGVLELLDSDERAVFILDLTKPDETTPIYTNPRLKELQLLGSKVGESLDLGAATKDEKHRGFLEWAGGDFRDGKIPVTLHCGVKWTAQTLKERWRVIAGDVGGSIDVIGGKPMIHRSQTLSPQKARPMSKSGDSPRSSLESQLEAYRLHREDTISIFPPAQEPFTLKEVSEVENSTLGPFDILAPDTVVEPSPHLRFFLDFDWASTELGSIESWPLELRRMCNFLMSDPRPAAMFWGQGRVMMYNESYKLVTGQKHPGMMGKPFSEAWPEIEVIFKDLFNKAYQTGKPSTMDDARFYIDRHGYLEETYFALSIMPFSCNSYDCDLAVYNPVFDTTRQVVADRRMIFLLRLGQFIASSREPKEFWQQLLRGFEPDHPDLPFALLYSAGNDVNETLSESSALSHNSNWVLEGSVRVPDAEKNVPKHINSECSLEEFLPSFSELVKSDSPTLLHRKDGTIPASLTTALQGTLAWDTVVFLPIRATTDIVLGFLIIGLNARREYDDDYRLFIELLTRQLATSMAAAVLVEDDLQRGRMAAERAYQDRNRLSRKLEIQAHEAAEIESRFRRMADLAPVGMFHVDVDGNIVYANEVFYGLTEHPRNSNIPIHFLDKEGSYGLSPVPNVTFADKFIAKGWYGSLMEEDLPLMELNWKKLMDGEPVAFEIRLRTLFKGADKIGDEEIDGAIWTIVAAYPEKADDGTVVGVLGCMTDISRQKWAEDFQKRKMLEAVELKRQQENFIDMTSHEMRNPLSAIIQCADMIGISVKEFDGGTNDVILPREAVHGYADAASTIILCAQHQKRIIDDILTLSKLDSDLLFVTPIEVQPLLVIKNALKIFDGELQKSDVALRFHVSPSFDELGFDWIKLDPSRLVQVLINLVTNAIKFTQTQAKRNIAITVSAALEPPSTPGLIYLPRSNSHKENTPESEWGDGEIVYLHIEVQDSGRGLDDTERNLLFKRFSQASPRTHVRYGGSGLGLFISRELTELQGGQIGVASKAGVGSTFAFYIRTRRCDPPDDKDSFIPQMDVQVQNDIITNNSLARVKGPSRQTVKNRRSQSPASSSPKHILIVEDNIVNQKVLSKQLRTAGCIVSVANHGLEALEFLEKSTFSTTLPEGVPGIPCNILLMDLEMPVMDGLTCVQQIRQWEMEGKVKGRVPVIAVTANARSEQIARAKEAGMDSVVTKPFRIGELLPEMDRWLVRGVMLDGGKEDRAAVERRESAPI